MFSKKSLPVIALLLCAGLIAGFKSLGWGGGTPPSKYEKILHNIGEMLSQIHYSPKKIDDNFSKEIFKKYLSEKIDQQKNIFLQSDIAQLKKYETKLDDEILRGPVEFVPAVSDIYKKRILESEQYYKESLSKPFEFTKDESVNFDTDDLNYPATAEDKKEAWRKENELPCSSGMPNCCDTREKNKGKEGYCSED